MKMRARRKLIQYAERRLWWVRVRPINETLITSSKLLMEIHEELARRQMP